MYAFGRILDTPGAARSEIRAATVAPGKMGAGGGGGRAEHILSKQNFSPQH